MRAAEGARAAAGGMGGNAVSNARHPQGLSSAAGNVVVSSHIRPANSHVAGVISRPAGTGSLQELQERSRALQETVEIKRHQIWKSFSNKDLEAIAIDREGIKSSLLDKVWANYVRGLQDKRRDIERDIHRRQWDSECLYYTFMNDGNNISADELKEHWRKFNYSKNSYVALIKQNENLLDDIHYLKLARRGIIDYPYLYNFLNNKTF